MSCLELAHRNGHWVILNNIHLMPSWLIELEKKLDEFALEGSHEKFRLYLSSDPSPAIPIGVLSRCIKLTNEPPAGLKANLKRAFANFSRDYIEEVSMAEEKGQPSSVLSEPCVACQKWCTHGSISHNPVRHVRHQIRVVVGLLRYWHAPRFYCYWLFRADNSCKSYRSCEAFACRCPLRARYLASVWVRAVRSRL